MVCGRPGRPLCLHPGECWEGETDTPQFSYPFGPLYHARESARTMGRGGSYHCGCHDCSLWACFTALQIWVDEEDRRRVQSPPAPGTDGDSHSVTRLTLSPARGMRLFTALLHSASVVEQQPLLLRCFNRMGSVAANPLERLRTREPQDLFGHVGDKQSCASNAR